MTQTNEASDFRQKLLDKRRQIFENRSTLQESYQNLQRPEIEPEETGSKLQLSQGFDRLDEREKNEIEAIHKALGKLESGGYGTCERCGKTISKKRLEAIPWTPFCIECAAEIDNRIPVEPAEASSPSTTSQQELSDEEIEETVLDILRRDGRVELQELTVRSRNGVLHLEGRLPSENKHEILLSIIDDTLDFDRYVDNIRIDPFAWQDRRRTPGRKKAERTDDEKLMEGEEANENTHESIQSGEPLTPPDALIREKKD
jgi:RNA polymerase-binding protein DksA